MTGKTGRKTAGILFFIVLFAGVGHSFGEEKPMTSRLKEIESLFNNFNSDTLDLADDFYDPDVVFLDPIVELKGRDSLKAYYADMYKNVTSIRFDFSGGVEKDDEAVVFWTMEVRSEGFKGGEPVLLDGTSHIKFGGESGKAVYHRDYFDMGAFVYENIPVLGSIVRYVKKRLGDHGEE